MKRSLVLMMAVLLLMPGASAIAGQDGGTTIEELAVQLATTPSQHAVVADYYRSQAAVSRAEGVRHRSMRRAYQTGNMRAKKQLQEHCGKLIASSEAIALQYDQLAKAHDALAK